MSLTSDEKFRLEKQWFIKDMLGKMPRQTGEYYVKVFGFLAQNMLAFLAGNRGADTRMAPVNLPLDEKMAGCVKVFWQEIMQSVAELCTDSSGKLDEIRFRWVLLWIYDKIFEGIRVSVESDYAKRSARRA